jgi:hypothetical protein
MFAIRFFGANIHTAQNLKDQPAQQMPEPILAHGNKIPGSCNGLFSEGFPTEGPGGKLTHPTLRTSFPLPTQGRPNGHREAPLLISNFPRVAQHLLACKSLSICLVPFRLSKKQLFATDPEYRSAAVKASSQPVGKCLFLWEKPVRHRCRCVSLSQVTDKFTVS